ncbi:hypothetical protein [Chitinophaga sp.]|uniref:hypothetical protein n=1 Tax=Chitinophaga sp. TaxID=1869181 RepID=UPI0031DAF2CC
MEKRLQELIMAIPMNELFLVENPSEDHPDNQNYYRLKDMGVVKLHDTEDSGIIAVGLTARGILLQKKNQDYRREE